MLAKNRSADSLGLQVKGEEKTHFKDHRERHGKFFLLMRDSAALGILSGTRCREVRETLRRGKGGWSIKSRLKGMRKRELSEGKKSTTLSKNKELERFTLREVRLDPKRDRTHRLGGPR